MDPARLLHEGIEPPAQPPGLDSATRARLDAIAERLAQLAGIFPQHVAAATRDWSKHVESAEALDGLPSRALQRARERAQREQREGHLLTLDRKSYRAALEYLHDRKLRHDLYEAHVTRASDHGPRTGRFDNGPLVQEALALRHESAQLMGFSNYAEARVRGSVFARADDVERYLLRGGVEGRAQAQAELDAIWTFARAQGAPKGFSTWDLPYYARRFRAEQTGLCSDSLREYLALPDVLAGFFALSEAWLGVRALSLPAAPHRWLHRVQTVEGRELCLLELAAFASEDALERVQLTIERQDGELPILHVTCDFELAPDSPAVLLDHADLAALFRTLGRGLSLLLDQRARDAPIKVEARGSAREQNLEAQHSLSSEIAGRYFEQFCFHFPSVSRFARHHESGATLPEALFEQLLRAHAIHRGLAQAEERELALFDLRIHRDYVPLGKATQLRAHVFDTLSQVRREVCVLRPPFWDRSPNTCLPIFAQDRAVRIWESSWARQMAEELFRAAEARGFDRDTARQQREKLWCSPKPGVLDRLTDVLGRPPTPHA